METTVATTASQGGVWGGGNHPLRASYGKTSTVVCRL